MIEYTVYQYLKYMKVKLILINVLLIRDTVINQIGFGDCYNAYIE